MGKDGKGQPFAHDPAQRGYTVTYRLGETNHCPGCGRSHWLIGRMLAECGFCATAIPLDTPPLYGSGMVRVVTRRDREGLLAA